LSEESVVIHKITDDASASGELFEDVIGELVQALAGNIMLVHHAKIETAFLKQACMKLYGISIMHSVMPYRRQNYFWHSIEYMDISSVPLRLSRFLS